jgi:hypothetical protein
MSPMAAVGAALENVFARLARALAAKPFTPIMTRLENAIHHGVVAFLGI